MNISLEQFVQYLILQWKMIFVMTFVGVSSFVAMAFLAGNEIVIEPSEEYVYLVEQKNVMDDYMKNSVIMKMDAQNVCYRLITINDISDREEVKEVVLSGQIWNNFHEQLPDEYLKELLSWEQEYESGKVELKIRHSDVNLCAEYAEYVAKELRSFDLGVTIGKQNVEADDSVLMLQLMKKDLEHKIESNLEIAAAGYTIQVSKIAAVGIGAFFGALLSIVILFFKYLLKDQWR